MSRHLENDKNRPEIPYRWIMSMILMTFVTIMVACGGTKKSGGTFKEEQEIKDEQAIKDIDSEKPDSIVNNSAKGVPNITYEVTASNEDEDYELHLCAVIDGDTVVIWSIDDIFGEFRLGHMDVFEQDDFDGDGIQDALVCDVNIGNGGGTNWIFVTYAGGKSFNKSNIFSEYSYYEPEIAIVNGKKVLDFIKMDMGQKAVRERHGLINGKAVSMATPKYKTPPYTKLKTVNMEKLKRDDSFDFDLDGDGQKEKIVTTGSFHFGRGFTFMMNGQEYEFSVGTLWGSGKLHILKSKTNGMHDIMTQQDTRTVYKWDGSTYTSN